MITPAFPITATERVLPRLALDFTTAILDPRVTFARSGNTATVTDSTGNIAAINANLPRFDFDPSTLSCRGLLIEEARTNLLLNSLIDGTSLATQTVTVTAAAHTLSFYGAGQVVLSGVHSATVTGAGAYPSRRIYAFTPTAGSLTLTVTGTVQFANLELGAFATSFIPTDGTVKTRSADIASMTGTNFSSWWNASQGAIELEFVRRSNAVSGKFPYTAYILSDAANRFDFYQNSTANESVVVKTANVNVAPFSSALQPGGSVVKQALAYATNNFGYAVNGSATTVDSAGGVPSVSSFYIGATSSTGFELNGWMRKINYWPQRITNPEVQAFSK